MKSKIILISTFIIVELIIIFLLGAKIYDKQHIGAMIINPIERESVIFSGDGRLKNFYESAPKSHLEKQWEGQTLTYTINSDSLNERFEYTTDKPEGTFRIITLGDSFTFGMGVNTKDNYSEVLEDLLNDSLHCANFEKFEVINLGVPGYDIEYSVERFRRRGQKYDPDLLLWFLIHNDFKEITEIIKPRYDFYREKKRAYSGSDTLTDEEKYEKLMEIRTMAKQDQYKMISEEEMERYQEEALRSIDNYYKNTLLFFGLTLDRKFIQIIEKFIESRGNSYLLQQNIHREQYQHIDGHPNKEGHAFFAENIFNYLIEKNIIPCD